LDKSKDITDEIVEEINNDLTEVDKAAGKKMKINRRPPLNYKDMQIPVGAKLLFSKDDRQVEVEVSGDKKVLYKGVITSLTAVTRELLELSHDVQPTPYWTYNGRNLKDIYNETNVIGEE
jgi:hypothetical protein